MVNGKWTVSSSDPNYTGSPGNWQGKIADAKVAGPITIHLTWNGSGDKPKSVILAITSTAIATGDLLQSVNDGIGDTASSGVSTGTHYFVVTDPGTSADYVVSGIAAEGKQSALSGGGSFAPIRGAAGIAPSGAQFATASIQLSASVVIPTMDVKGLTLDTSLNPHVLIGQRLRCSVSTGLSATPSGYSWSADPSGHAFANYTASTSTGQKTTWPDVTQTASTDVFFADNGNGTVSGTSKQLYVHCDVTINSLSLTIPIESKFFVDTPSKIYGGNGTPLIGSMQFVNDGTNDLYMLYGSTATVGGANVNLGIIRGVHFSVSLPFTNSPNPGHSLTFAQILQVDPTMGITYFDNSFLAASSSTNWLLDTQFPYPGITVDNSSDPWNDKTWFKDAPSIRLVNLPASGATKVAKEDVTFKTYELFKPASTSYLDANNNTVTLAATYVPLERMDWIAVGTATQSSSGVWSQSQNSQMNGISQDYTHPEWASNIIGGAPVYATYGREGQKGHAQQPHLFHKKKKGATIKKAKRNSK